MAREQSIAGAAPALPPPGTGQVFVLWDGEGKGTALPSPPHPVCPALALAQPEAALGWGCGQGWQRVSEGSARGTALCREGGGK